VADRAQERAEAQRIAETSFVPPYQADDFDDEGFVLSCTWCGGEGEFFGNELPGYDPGWHDPERVYDCPACGGSGERRDQRLF